MNFLEKCKNVRREIEKMERPLVVGHYDSDGISSTAIVLLGLRDMGKEFSVKTVRKLGEKELGEISEDEIIFVDLGSGVLDLLGKTGRRIVVIDHHQRKGDGIGVIEANPHEFGIDGGKELSAAGVAYRVFGDAKMSHLAVVGAVGDMQHPLRGMNRVILEEGQRAGLIEIKRDLTLYGRFNRPLAELLCYSTSHYFPGLTEDVEACRDFIEMLGIEQKREKWRRYVDLSMDEKVRFVTALVKHLYAHGLDEKARELVGEVYEFPNEPEETRDANEFSTLLNACGRNKKPEIGIRLCMGDEKARNEARAILRIYRKKLREGIEFAVSSTEERDAYYIIDGRGKIEDGIIGVIAGMMYKQDKPVIGLAYDDEGNVKVSARASSEVVKRGVNLGRIMVEACEGIGNGGGHKMAAGASVKKENLEAFMRRLDEALGAFGLWT
ncbi:MAG: DHH family phosphoesterase [Candidatus Micrarchaeia archaeon]